MGTFIYKSIRQCVDCETTNAINYQYDVLEDRTPIDIPPNIKNYDVLIRGISNGGSFVKIYIFNMNDPNFTKEIQSISSDLLNEHLNDKNYMNYSECKSKYEVLRNIKDEYYSIDVVFKTLEHCSWDKFINFVNLICTKFAFKFQVSYQPSKLLEPNSTHFQSMNKVVKDNVNDSIQLRLINSVLSKSNDEYINRGKKYVTRNLIDLVNVSENDFKFVAHGSSTYDITIKFKQNDIDSWCSCPLFYQTKQPCKHILGALLILTDFYKNNKLPQIMLNDDIAIKQILKYRKKYETRDIKEIRKIISRCNAKYGRGGMIDYHNGPYWAGELTTLVSYAYKLIEIDWYFSVEILIAILKNTYKWVSKIDDDGVILGMLDDTMLILKIIINKFSDSRKIIHKYLKEINITKNAKEYIGEDKINDFLKIIELN